ncbi:MULTISPECIES: MFS transporter [unclassified Gilliamella]|uniref:MFS transporter n=1 Tax=unclassified Gilliamella TaxID=2685620 RepID=UPI00226A5936|nr:MULTISPECIES: MFS transporter [unclassified Gilliamella]MCX8601231.1 MFS transporter [Gilliamella sp. B3722]MCX8607385.1 MFS transporter [Gilliamella sp. B3771]MCX8610426.1 MFS transporter [Gilliamella sp. B3891]MCX8612905.1 MFS transporter [Gilliamella sp. B3773]MCX8614814.1 MFS transporter [Gilliamella sp. B3770]
MNAIFKSKGYIRWLMIILFATGVILNYVDRNALGIMAQEIINDLQITPKEYSYITGAFQLAYTIFQPIVGWFVDVIGLRVGFAIMVIIWSLMCMLHAGAGAWIHLAILRFVMGGAESVVAPANAKVISSWFPKKERAIANGWSMVGFSLGAMIAPPLIYFIHQFGGWQLAFLIPGSIGIIWAGIWLYFFSEPAKSRFVTDAERKYILSDQDIGQAQQDKNVWHAIKQVVTQKKFYGIAIPAFLAEPAWAAVNFWVPFYLLSERGMQLKEMAMFVWIPFLAADFGGLSSGYFSRMLDKYFGLSRINAACITYLGAAFFMLSMVFASLAESPYLAIALIAIGAWGHQMLSAMLTIQVIENFDGKEVSTVNGLRGSSAWIASFLFTIIVGQFVEKIGFKPFFITMGFLDIIGAIIMCALLFQRKPKGN